MSPTDFPQANFTFLPPVGREAVVADLRVYRDEDHIISRWEPTDEDRARIAAGGPVFLWIMGGVQPPVCLTTEDPWGGEDA